MGYYVKYTTHQDGPFDLVTMIRKIRNGQIPPEAMVMEEKEHQAQPARQHPDLNSFFHEHEEGYVSEETVDTIEHLNFTAVMNYGWGFFSQNLVVGLFSALMIFVTLCYAFIIIWAANGSLLPSILLIGIAASFFICGFIFLLQRLQQQQPFSLFALREFYREHWGNIVMFSCIYAVTALAGFALLIIPGFIILSRLAFAPILVVDRNYHFWHAIESSNQAVKQGGAKLSGVLLGLIGLNLIAMLLILPLIITLPVTFIGLIAIYRSLSFH